MLIMERILAIAFIVTVIVLFFQYAIPKVMGYPTFPWFRSNKIDGPSPESLRAELEKASRELEAVELQEKLKVRKGVIAERTTQLNAPPQTTTQSSK